MNNPRIYTALNILGVNSDIDVDKVFILYDGKNHQFKCSIYLDYSIFGENEGGQPPFDYQVDVASSLRLLTAYTGISFTEGTDRMSIYLTDSHRKVLDIRYILPEGYLQMSLDDEFVNVSTDEELSKYLRSLMMLN